MSAEVLDLLLLAAVRTRPLHGYALIEQLHVLSGGTLELPEGTVYPALHRLERAGLLSSRWSRHAGRRRRIYKLTRKGRTALEDRRDEWRRFSRTVELVLEGAG